MASAWGSAWAGKWGDAWGALAGTPPPPAPAPAQAAAPPVGAGGSTGLVAKRTAARKRAAFIQQQKEHVIRVVAELAAAGAFDT